LKEYSCPEVVKLILLKLPSQHIESNKIFIKNLQILTESDIFVKSYQELLDFLMKLLDKFFDNAQLMLYILDTVNKVTSNKKIRDFIKKDFYDLISKITASTSCHKVATLGLQIIDIILALTDDKELTRGSKPISFIVKLLTKFKDDNILSFHACSFLSKILEKDDVSLFLRILKIKDVSSIDSICENNSSVDGMLSEIKEMFANQDETTFNMLKKNITRALIIISKDKSFLQLLKDINSLDIFVDLLKSDLDIYSEKIKYSPKGSSEISMIESLLPDFIRLVMSLLKTYELDYTIERAQRLSVATSLSISGCTPDTQYDSKINPSNFGKDNSNQVLFSNIYSCMINSLKYFISDKQLIYDILDFLVNKDKAILEDFIFHFKEHIDRKMILINLLKTYYDKKWIYGLLYRMTGLISIGLNENINSDCREFVKNIESLTLIENEQKITNMINFTFSITVSLMFNIYKYDDNSFQEFYSLCLKYIEMITRVDNFNIISSLITLLFCSIENKTFGLAEEKGKLLSLLMKKLLHNEKLLTDTNLNKYLIMRLNRLVELKVENYKQIANIDLLCEYIIYNLNQLKSSTKKDEESGLKEILSIIIFILNNSESFNISKFLRENGLIILLQLTTIGIHDFDINKSIVNIIINLSDKNFKEVTLIYKNYISLRILMASLKDISFNKGINERIYYEILVLFKNVIKSCEYAEVAEEANIVDYFINEYNEIYSFYLDTRNRLLEIISEILAIFSKEKIFLKNLINSKLPIIIENILKNVIDSKTESACEKIIENYANIFTSFFKSKAYSKLIYNQYLSSLENMKTILFNSRISENCMLKLLMLIHLLIEYENIELLKDKIVTPIFLRELSIKIPTNQKTTKDFIEKCLNMIENPFLDKVRKSIHESNNKLIKELSDLAKSERKNAVSRKTYAKASTFENVLNFNQNHNNENFDDFKRKSAINLKDNPNISAQFENIVNNIKIITELIENDEDTSPKELESEQLSHLIKMLCIFAKEFDNIQRICESGVVDKLLYIMEDNNSILSFVKDIGFNLVDKLIEHDVFINYLYKNSRACEFFLKEMSKITKIYLPDSSEFVRNKIFIVTKTICKLSSDKIFLQNNSDYISNNSIFFIISTFDSDKDILSNLLVIFNNIILNTEGLYNNFKISDVLLRIWKNYNEIRVIEKIMKIIENLYLEESIIKDLIESNFIDNINSILANKRIDSEGVLNVLEMVDKLMFHRYFGSKLIDQKTINTFIETLNLNIFNTKIVDITISIFTKAARFDKNFITILGIYGVNSLCIFVLSKYMLTCHSNIIKQTLQLVFILISDDNNLKFFANGENMDIILKNFKAQINTKEHVLLCLKLVNLIIIKDINIKAKDLKEDKNDRAGRQRKATVIEPVEGSNYDFTILIEIINDILASYDEFIDIILQLCELINNVFKLSKEIWLKKFMMDVIINNADKYLNKQDYIEIFLKTLYNMIKSDKTIIDMDNSSIIYYMSKLLSINLSYNMAVMMLKAIKHLSRSKSINTSSNLIEVIKILKTMEMTEKFHDDEVLLLFSQILSYLCVNTSYHRELSSSFILFFLKYLIKKPTSSNIHSRLLEDLKNNCVYFFIYDEETSKQICDLIYCCFDINLKEKNKKNLMNICQMISSLCIQSELVKISMNEMNFSESLKETLMHDNIDDTLLEYQMKGCLLNLKIKRPQISSKQTNSSTLRSMSLVFTRLEVKDEIKIYLQTERQIKT
jgi:hypothetical protein